MTARRPLPWLLLGVVMAASAVLLMYAGRETTFFYDDWPYVLDRGAWSLDTFLEPHNEHLQAVSVLIYKVLFETVGLHDYGVYRFALVVLDLLCGVLLFVYARGRVGTWPALGLAACLVVMAASWYNLVYAFQVNFVGAMAAGLGALLCFDRGGRRWDALGSALLCVSIASSSVGFPFLIGAVVEVLWRPDRWRRLWVAGVPVVLYGLWMVAYGDGGSARASNLDAVPDYVVDGYDDSVAAITGLTVEFGVVVAFALVVLVTRELLAFPRVDARLAAVVVMPLSFWALTALGRADMGVEADANRYLYASGLFVALAAVEALRHYALSGRLAVIVGVLLGFGFLHNASGVEQGGDILRTWSGSGKDAATALDIAGPSLVPPWYADADPTQGFIEARRYFAAVRRYGSSPGFTLEELAGASEERRAGTDDKLLRVLQFGVGSVKPGHPTSAEAPEVAASEGGAVSAAGRGCLRFVPAPGVEEGGSWVEVVSPADGSGTFVRARSAPVELRLRRFASGFPEAAKQTIVPGSSGGWVLPRDRAASIPWRAQLRGTAPFLVCASD
ncbi:MAG: hypothetical protein M3389_10725 [Actinomycetota bacterium]|nr:hypothetical protein [Actinomycetota bacterium]